LARVLSLLQFGVQDVLPPTDAAGVARALRLAIERKRIEMTARKAYATDLATGLPNHMQLMEHMTHLVALRAREPAPMALIVLRIEGLPATEAALGAEAANVLKRKVAVRLRSALRASDVVASLGGDAFAVLLAWIDAPDDGERVARKLAQSLTQPFSVTGRQRHIAVRVGLALYPAQGDRVEDLMRRALGQAASVATVGKADYAYAADRGPSAAANDEG
jgi:diguanylate cyclase (GGDEF)-like protein